MINKLQRTQKAWHVYHEGMIRYEHGYYQHKDELPLKYANTRNEARKKGVSDCYDYSKEDESELTFTDIIVVRVKECDKYLFEGRDLTNREIAIELKKRERNNKLKALPDDKLYLLQKRGSYVGNAVVFWGENNCGYYCNMENVGKYTKEDMLKIAINNENIVVWDADYIDSVLVKVADAQNLNHAHCVG